MRNRLALGPLREPAARQQLHTCRHPRQLRKLRRPGAKDNGQPITPGCVRFFGYCHIFLSILLFVLLVKVCPASVPIDLSKEYAPESLGGHIKLFVPGESQVMLVHE